MKSFNQVILLGNLGQDPETLTSTEKGLFVRLSLATHRQYTDPKGVLQDDTQWHTVYVSNATGKAAAEHLKKGSRVHVIGELRKSEWKDKKTGDRKFETAVHASSLIFLDAKVPDQTLQEPVEEAETVTAA